MATNDLSAALEVRRTQLDRIEQASGGVFTVRIFLQVHGAGEVQTNLNFPVRFTEMPSLATGWSMLQNQNLYTGAFPVASAGVYVWNFGRTKDTGAPFFDGATLAMTVEGPTDLVLLMHLTFVGTAVRQVT